MGRTFGNLREGDKAEVSNPSIVADFLRQLVGSLEPGWVWMGSSLVTDPLAWTTRHDPVSEFARAIQRAVTGKRLKVFRLYALRSPEIDIRFKTHLASELKKGLTIKVHYNPGSISDLSFIWRPVPGAQAPGDSGSFSPSPGASWIELDQNGWEPAFAIHWDILESATVERITVYPGTDTWVSWNYDKLHQLWVDGVDVAPTGIPSPPQDRS